MLMLHCNDFASFSAIRKIEVKQKGKDTSTILIPESSEVTVVFNFELFPLDVEDKLIEIVKKREALKKEFDTSLGLIYQLRNSL